MKLDIYPRRKPIVQDLDTDFEFNHCEGEDYEIFARRRYRELLEENSKQFSELCNQAMEIDQLHRKVEKLQKIIAAMKKAAQAFKELYEMVMQK